MYVKSTLLLKNEMLVTLVTNCVSRHHLLRMLSY